MKPLEAAETVPPLCTSMVVDEMLSSLAFVVVLAAWFSVPPDATVTVAMEMAPVPACVNVPEPDAPTVSVERVALKDAAVLCVNVAVGPTVRFVTTPTAPLLVMSIPVAVKDEAGVLNVPPEFTVSVCVFGMTYFAAFLMVMLSNVWLAVVACVVFAMLPA